jgi:hypothetical protein
MQKSPPQPLAIKDTGKRQKPSSYSYVVEYKEENACGTRRRENAKIATSATLDRVASEKAKTEFIPLRCRI